MASSSPDVKPEGMPQGIPQGDSRAKPQGMPEGIPQGIPQGDSRAKPQGRPPRRLRLSYRDIFLAIGLVAIVVMLLTLDMSWADLLSLIRRAGIWLPAAILLWLPIYLINAHAWRVILNGGGEAKVGFWRMVKYTISGYALNYVTPVGLLGGEPYRIMELSAYVGGTRATSSVILYSMTHIFSHFCFWAFSVVLFLALHLSSIQPLTAALLALISLFCAFGIYFFLRGYRKGLAMRTLRLLSRLPLLGARVGRYMQGHSEAIAQVDRQIAALHAQRRGTFLLSVGLEFAARMLGSLEIMFLLLVFLPRVSYGDCVLIQAFQTLFANLLFFVPMQMGTREGGLAIITDGLRLTPAVGVLTGLLTRLRELVWIAIGLLLIKVGQGGASPRGRGETPPPPPR